MATYKVLKDFTQYEISDNGIIRKIVSKTIVKQRVHPREGLMMCDLYDNNLVARTVYPHKEVAKTFMPTKRKGRLLVIHKNGKKKDNKVQNLQWITMGNYQKKQVENGTRKQLGNPELYKHSKFWKAKNKKLKGKIESKVTTKIVAKPKKAGKILDSKTVSLSLKQKGSDKTKNKLKKVISTPAVKKTKKPVSAKRKVIITKGKKVVKAAKPVSKKTKVIKLSPSKATQVKASKPLAKNAKKTVKKIVKPAVAKVAKKKISKPVKKSIVKVATKVSPAKSKKPIKKASTIKKSGAPVPLKSKPSANEVVKSKTKRNRIKAKKVFSVKN